MGYGMTCATTLRQRWRKVAQTTPKHVRHHHHPPTGAEGGGGASLHAARGGHAKQCPTGNQRDEAMTEEVDNFCRSAPYCSVQPTDATTVKIAALVIRRTEPHP